MIMHSDNTATDMCLKQVGTDKVRAFIASAGLKHTLIPDSTRVYIGYLLNAPNYKTFSWADLMKAYDNDVQLVNSPLNDKEALAASADDFISYYPRALQGEFFQHKETLTEFRRILSIGEDISAIPMPLGVSGFAKGGNVDVPGFHAASTAGAMAFGNRWVYFCFTCNWKSPGIHDPATAPVLAATIAQTLNKIKVALS
jgi:beta-lactamase class A